MTVDTISLEEARQENARTKSGLHTRDIDELVSMEIPPREWHLEPVIPSKGTVMIFGSRGLGKTYVSTSMACAVASGSGLWGWKTKEPRPVLFVDGEMPLVALQERFVNTIAGMEFKPPGQEYLKILAADDQEFGIPDLTTEKGRMAIEAHLVGRELLILDNISTLFRSGRENDAQSWTEAQEWFLKLRRDNISTVLIHHAGKGGGQRGTSRREDILDTVIALKRPTDYQPEEGARFIVEFEKSRGAFGEEVAPFEAKLNVVDGAITWTTKPLEDVKLQKIADLTNDGLSIRDIEKETDIPKSTVARLLKKARAQGMLT